MLNEVNPIECAKAVGTETSIFFLDERMPIININHQVAEPLGVIKGLVLHWSAGLKHQIFDEYHYNVVENSKKQAGVVQSLLSTQKGSHLARRNTGLIGISISSMRQPKLKKDQPSPAQQFLTALLIAELCCWKNLNPTGTFVANKQYWDPKDKAFVPMIGSINAPVISDHKYWAKQDKYFPDRWDIDTYFQPIYETALVLYSELKANKRQFKFKDIL